MTEVRQWTLAFVVNGSADGLLGMRARAFAERLGDDTCVRIAYRGPRRVRAVREFLVFLRQAEPDLVYVFDLGYSGIAASLLYARARRVRLIVETGDVIWALWQATGRRGRLACTLARVYEKRVLRSANAVTVRGTVLRDYVQRQGATRVEVLPDGVDTQQFRPFEATDLRARLGLDGAFTVGLVGSLVWSPRQRWCYGMELLAALAQLRDLPVKGLIVGDGSGKAHLTSRAQELGLSDRVVLTGWVPHNDLPPFINCMDVCLSTQTNDLIGSVRTTAKLPLYLACGRFVIASSVGDVARVLPREMLLEYQGSYDPEYPVRLGDRLRELISRRGDVETMGLDNVRVAKANFDYGVLANRLRSLCAQLWSGHAR